MSSKQSQPFEIVESDSESNFLLEEFGFSNTCNSTSTSISTPAKTETETSKSDLQSAQTHHEPGPDLPKNSQNVARPRLVPETDTPFLPARLSNPKDSSIGTTPTQLKTMKSKTVYSANDSSYSVNKSIPGQLPKTTVSQSSLETVESARSAANTGCNPKITCIEAIKFTTKSLANTSDHTVRVSTSNKSDSASKQALASVTSSHMSTQSDAFLSKSSIRKTIDASKTSKTSVLSVQSHQPSKPDKSISPIKKFFSKTLSPLAPSFLKRSARPVFSNPLSLPAIPAETASKSLALSERSSESSNSQKRAIEDDTISEKPIKKACKAQIPINKENPLGDDKSSQNKAPTKIDSIDDDIASTVTSENPNNVNKKSQVNNNDSSNNAETIETKSTEISKTNSKPEFRKRSKFWKKFGKLGSNTDEKESINNNTANTTTTHISHSPINPTNQKNVEVKKSTKWDAIIPDILLEEKFDLMDRLYLDIYESSKNIKMYKHLIKKSQEQLRKAKKKLKEIEDVLYPKLDEMNIKAGLLQ